MFFIPCICSCLWFLFCAFLKWLQVRMKSLSFWSCWDFHGTWPTEINKNKNKHSKHTLLLGKSKGSFSGESQPLSLHKACLDNTSKKVITLFNKSPWQSSVSPPQEHLWNKELLLDSHTLTPVFLPHLTVSLVLCAHTLTRRHAKEGKDARVLKENVNTRVKRA